MKISVIIPFRENGGEFLKEKLQTLFSGNFKDFEVIVVDDSSPFPAQEVIKEFPSVKLVKLENSPPFNMAKAKNRGADEAQGDFLMFSDVDVLFSSDLMKELIDDNFEVIYGWVQFKDNPACYHLTYFSLIKRDFFFKIGGFDERFSGFYGYDDVFLEWKVDKFGGKIKVVESSLVAEMKREDKGSYAPDKGELTSHNRELFNQLTSSYQYIPLIQELVDYPGYLSDDDMRILGHFALEAKKGIVEIGSLAGKSAKVFLHFSNLPLVCIDNYAFGGVNLPPSFGLDREISNQEAKDFFYQNVVNVFPQRVKHLEKSSDEAINDLNDFPFDLLFIDGDHTYEQVKKDFENYSKKIEKGGIILFHDYHHPDYPGVAQFVDELQEGVEKLFLTESMAVLRYVGN